VKIGALDPEITLLKGLFLKKKEINASRTYSPQGRHATGTWAKLVKNSYYYIYSCSAQH